MKALQNIGLTKTESEIYILLIKFGEVPASKLIKETRYHPQVIYRALDGLLKKGLVFAQIHNSKKFFRPEEPEQLLKLEREKMEELKNVVSRLQVHAGLSKDAIIKVFRGAEEVILSRSRAYEELNKGEAFYIIGASSDRFYQIVGGEYDRLEKKRIKKGVKKKMLVYQNKKEELLKHDMFLDGTEIKYLADGLQVPSSTNIYKNTVLILIWEFNPIVIHIESKAVAESYRQYFDLLWQHSHD